MKYFVLVAVLFFVTAAVPALAVKRSGHDLLIDCRNLVETEAIETVEKEKLLGMGYCIGLIDGLITFNYVYEAVLEQEGDAEIVQMCLPARLSTRQSAKVIVKYLEDNPDRMDESGQALAAQALVDAFPCDKSNSEGQ